MTENLPARTEAAKQLAKRIDTIVSAYPDHNEQSRQRFAHIGIALANSHELAKCDPRSVVIAIYGCAVLGLIPDKTLGHVYVIPRKVKGGGQAATLMPGYRGYMELARRGGKISYIDARVVYTNDDFDVRHGTNPGITHRPWFTLGRDKAGEPWAAYCVAKLVGEDLYQFDVMTRAEIEAAKKSSEGANKDWSPWVQHPAEMWRKTVVRRASKYWPLETDLARAVAWDEQRDRGERQHIHMPEFGGKPQEADTDPLMDGIDDPPEGDQDGPKEEDAS